jgi:hypothetical protein
MLGAGPFPKPLVPLNLRVAPFGSWNRGPDPPINHLGWELREKPMSRTRGSYMVQPTKDELWLNIWELKKTISTLKGELELEKLRHTTTQKRLETATRKIGELVLDQESEKEFAQAEMKLESKQPEPTPKGLFVRRRRV